MADRMQALKRLDEQRFEWSRRLQDLEQSSTTTTSELKQMAVHEARLALMTLSAKLDEAKHADDEQWPEIEEQLQSLARSAETMLKKAKAPLTSAAAA